jgi:hypothetical protein
MCSFLAENVYLFRISAERKASTDLISDPIFSKNALRNVLCMELGEVCLLTNIFNIFDFLLKNVGRHNI